MKINIAQSAIAGYKTVWGEREYILKLALIPIIIKFVCSMAVFILETDVFTLRFILTMLPSYCADGWLVAHLLRLLLVGERLPMPRIENPSKTQITTQKLRKRAISSAILYSMLIMMVQGGIAVGAPNLMDILGIDPITQDWNPSIIVFALYTVGFVAMIWSVRFIWLYIPLSINAPLKGFLQDIKSLITSYYIIGIWLLAVVPTLFITVLVPAMFMDPSSETLYDVPTLYAFIIVLLRVVGELLSGVIVVTAITYAFKDILKKYGAKLNFEHVTEDTVK